MLALSAEPMLVTIPATEDPPFLEYAAFSDALLLISMTAPPAGKLPTTELIESYTPAIAFPPLDLAVFPNA